MDKKELLKSIKNLLGVSVSLSKQVAFAMYSTESGAEVKIDGEIVVGAPVFVIDPETASEVPAPDGEHVLTGVAKIMVTGGVITEIMPIEEEEEPSIEIEVEASADPSEEIEAEVMNPDMMSEMDSRIKSLEDKISKISMALDSLLSATTAMNSVVTELSKQPTEEPSKPVAFSAFKGKKEKNMAYFNKLATSLKDLNK
jgi:hypothetical protein